MDAHNWNGAGHCWGIIEFLVRIGIVDDLGIRRIRFSLSREWLNLSLSLD